MIRHILSDGRKLDDISGFIIRRRNKEIYSILERGDVLGQRRIKVASAAASKEKYNP